MLKSGYSRKLIVRRYYANSVLDYVHRGKAIKEWRKVLDGESVNLERALGAFDLFILHDRNGDLNEVRFCVVIGFKMC